MKLYLAGPMSGLYNFNFGAFDRARDRLVELGHEVISPADLDRVSGLAEVNKNVGGGDVTPAERAWYLKRDVGELVGCDAIVLLDGWEESKGANIELLVSVACGLDRFRFYDTSETLRRSSDMPQIHHVQSHLHEVVNSAVIGL